MKKIGALLVMILVTAMAKAQGTGYTQVIGTIPSYAGGNVSAGFVPNPNASGPYTLNGSSFGMTNGAAISSTGTFSFYLADNLIVTPTQPAPSQWKITACTPAPQICNAATLTITGTSPRDVSSSFPSATPEIAYQFIEQAGVPFAQRLNLNFLTNMSCSDNPSNNSTDCTPSGGGGGGSYPGITATRNLFLTNIAPITTGVSDDVVIGNGAAPGLIPGGSAIGGQVSVIIGSGAGAAVTTARADVLIGYQAGFSLTGNGLGADDMIFTCIGPDSCPNVSDTTSGAGVFIGEQAGTDITRSLNDTMVGVHVAANLTNSQGNSFFGNGIVGATNAPVTGLVQGNTFMGFNIGNLAATGGTFSYNTCLGYQDCTDLNTALYNVVAGYRSGSSITTGTDNVILGSQNTGATDGPGVTGNFNTYIGTGHVQTTGFALTSGSNNVVLGNNAGSGISTGGANVVLGQLAASSLATGNNNVIIGLGAGQGMGSAVNSSIVIGQSAGRGITVGAINTSPIVIGSNAGSTALSGTNDILLGNSADGITTGTNDIAIGTAARASATGTNNTALGNAAKAGTAAGGSDTAIGAGANTGDGGNNTAVGAQAGLGLTTGGSNALLGYQAGAALTTGIQNTIVGPNAGYQSAPALATSTLVGYLAGRVEAGNSTTAVGATAGTAATVEGTWIGFGAGVAVTTGTGNSAFGRSAGHLVTTETNNTSVGETADTAVGVSGSTELGPGSCTVSNALCINGQQIADTSGNGYAKKDFNSATQTTVSCSTSGNVVFSQPEQGSSYKVVMIFANACLGTASYTYPTAFVNTPQVLSQSLAAVATTVTTTAVTITGTTSTGFLEINGY